MFSSFAHISPYILGLFMLTLACIPLLFVWQDSHRRRSEKKRLSALRREMRLAERRRAPVQGWGGEARR